jgi:4-amino-4-deoxy-L-arabinose transferase-like glycosyltransferase
MLSRTGSREFWCVAALLLSGLLFSLWRLGSLALFDLDEGGYAEIAREMIVLDDWIIPRLNFVRLLDKPPLLYWLTAGSFKLFGVSEFSARLPTALSIVGIMGLCAVVGKRFFGNLAGMLAAMIFATSAGLVIFETGRQLQPDILFTLFLTAALAALMFGDGMPQKREGFFIAGYAAMALAVMTKGLIGLVFPVMAIFGFALLTSEWGLIRQVLIWRGLAVFFLLAVPWHLAAELRSPGFLKFYLLDVHVLRFFNAGSIAASMTSLSVAGLWAGTALIFYPWTFFLPLVVWENFPLRLRNGTEAERAALWLWLWVGVLLLFFSLGSFRLFYYGLPALPALAVLSGKYWADVILRSWKRSLPGGHGPAPESPAACADPGAEDRASGPERTAGERSEEHAAAELEGRFRWGIPAASTPLFLIAAGVLTAALVPNLWQESLGRELYGMVDTTLMGYDDGAVTASKVVALPAWDDLASLALWCGSTLLAIALMALAAAVRRKYAWTFVCILLTMVALRYFGQVGTKVFEPFVSTKSLGTTISSTFQPGERIVMDGLYEDVACVTFYSGRKISMVHGVMKDLAFGSRFPDAAGTFLDEDEFFRLWDSGTRVYLLTDYPSNHRRNRDIFYSKLQLHYLGHSGSMKLFSNQPSSHAASGASGSGGNAVAEWEQDSSSPSAPPARDGSEPAGTGVGEGGKGR